MKNRQTFLVTIALSLVFLFSPSIVKVSAEESENEVVKESVENYFQAIKHQDLDEVLKWVVDTRFQTVDEQKEQYNLLFTEDSYTGYTVNDIRKNGNDYEATVTFRSKDSGEINQQTLPVIKQDGVWKTLITGQEIRSSNIKASSSNVSWSDKAPEVLPFAAVTYWEFFLTPNYSNPEYSSAFDMTGTSVNIVGWQESPGSSSDVSVVYQLVRKGWSGDKLFGETIIPKRYSQNGTWYTSSIRNVETIRAEAGVSVKITNPSSLRGVTGAGNAYQ